jgi:hypothetical protein
MSTAFLMCRVAESADASDLKVRQGQAGLVLPLISCGRGEMAYAPDLSENLSARRETGDAELLKFGEPCNMAIPSQARLKLAGKV